MAISRMQQPRQMYGLGSFVKKLTRKVTRPFTKVARKIVPKEIAGIMRVAAPFLGPVAGPAAYLLGTAKQTGRISPVDLALTLAPTVGRMQLPGYDSRFEKLIPDQMEGLTISEAIGDLPAFGKTPLGDRRTIQQVLTGGNFQDLEGVKTTTSGIFGKGGEMFKLGKGDVGLLDTKVGQTLFGKPEMVDGKATGSFVPSYLKIGSTGVSLASLLKDAKTPQEAGEALVAETGNPADYEAGVQLFSTLKPGVFDIPERFRLQSANGGLMRTNYALGSSDDDDKPVLPEDPTKPINPFGPKPIKPLGDMKMADLGDKFLSPQYEEEFRKFLKMLEESEKEQSLDNIMEMFKKYMLNKEPRVMEAATGGRANLALGTKPTTEESGLGGLPIEADMRYTGGFMPYGAKEKADDVPARISKNEFVFTADAVRAAGGGSVNKGAKKMYQTMKQLEAKPEAKGMMA